ncbi:hypothetical protein [Bradyrhizobium cosmicum]|uniref:hypothetical protein n=1 Tax=Bradyrhizobium cosmicum TaxID=1404864 RepID=UPI0028E2163A|nr:hypothetical protein [Bradyrhizobium cosmicum]
MALRREKQKTIGTKAPFPGFIAPVLAEQVDRVRRGECWIHEIKYDGYRGQLLPTMTSRFSPATGGLDLLYRDGRDLRRLVLLERKAALKQLIAGTPIAYSEHFDIEGGLG